MSDAPHERDERLGYQERVRLWMVECFGEAILDDTTERSFRLLEETLELVQACGATADEARRLVDYTFSRPVGQITQEVGGVMVCLAALCECHGEQMTEAGEAELARCWRNIEKIAAKHRSKPPGIRTSLPGDAALSALRHPEGASDAGGEG